jgi:hypothetical protein
MPLSESSPNNFAASSRMFSVFELKLTHRCARILSHPARETTQWSKVQERDHVTAHGSPFS